MSTEVTISSPGAELRAVSVASKVIHSVLLQAPGGSSAESVERHIRYPIPETRFMVIGGRRLR